MSYYLRIEGVNLGNFIMDTDDLSTIRGGSLLLLDAMNLVEETIQSLLPADIAPQEKLGRALQALEAELEDVKNSQERTPKNKRQRQKIRKQIKKLRKQLKALPPITMAKKTVKPEITITKGASWGLFRLNVDEQQALEVKEKVAEVLQKDEWKHATFVIDLHANNGDTQYQSDRDRLQTLNRWQQMQSPTLAIPAPGRKVCDFDKLRPADPGDRLAKEKKHISRSVKLRRDYGRIHRQEFYRKTTGVADLAYTNDLTQISEAPDKKILNGKIAYIYIDGNEFGTLQRRSASPDEQRQFDLAVRPGRATILRTLLDLIQNDPEWSWRDSGEKKDRIRLETLLWGGDEIIWVVPAWQGWWMVKTFYELAEKYLINPRTNTPLKHATGLVFCHHNAPVKRIDRLARRLADSFAKKQDRNKNLIAYQVLESFDHAGTDLHGYRSERVRDLGGMDNLLVQADDMEKIQRAIVTLKTPTMDFPRRKIYQIITAYRAGDQELAQEYRRKLPAEAGPELAALQGVFGNSHAHWYHLMELWDYLPDTCQGGIGS